MTDYKALVKRGHDYANQLADSTHIQHKGAELVGDLADAVEALAGIEQRLTDHINQLAAERDEAVKQLAESRANTGDMETRVVELEAVIEKVREAARENALDGELFYSTWHVDRALALAPPVVLADHDREVAARAWGEGFRKWDDWLAAHDGGRDGARLPDRFAANPYRVADQNGGE